MGFTKLHATILQSSIMAEPPEIFKVFVAILAATDPDGIARVSSTFLAAVCYFPLETIDQALAALEAPDLRSRSLNDEGRRIQKIDGGYLVINYEKYREFSYSMNPEAVRKREYRGKRKDEHESSGHSGTCPGHSASVFSSSPPSSFELKKEEILRLWNDFAGIHGLPKIKAIIQGSQRESHLKARLKDGMDFISLLDQIAAAPFLLGKEKNWRASFDWVLDLTNYQKIIEGNYRGVTPMDGPRQWLEEQEKKDADK